jgi:flagellin
MSLIVNTNVGSLNAQRSLAASGAELKTAMERLSSGKKINSAADDAAGFAIAERMTAQIRGLNMATKNANDGLSMLAVIENATNDVTDMLHRMRELAVQAINDTNSLEDRQFLQKEVSALIEEIDRVATQTRYNNQLVLNGSFQNKSIQVGTEAGQSISFSISGIKSEDLQAEEIVFIGNKVGANTDGSSGDNGNALPYLFGDDATNFNQNVNNGDTIVIGGNRYTVSNMSYSASGGGDGTLALASFKLEGVTQNEANAMPNAISLVKTTKVSEINLETKPSEALATISGAIEQVAGQRASYGALQNRLEYTVSNLMNVAEFTTSARSRIEDADFAAESARLAKAQVLQQTGTAMLAQANAQPQLALSLIR